MIRRSFSRYCWRVLERRAREWTASELARSAVVFSPHYDDETLGAGGTIIRKRRLGAPVHLVFMTDGSRSHAAAMDGDRLATLRRAEALRAAAALGVGGDRVRRLEFPEQRLHQHLEEASERVAAVLSELACAQVFVPSRREPLIWSADHLATTEIVFRALTRLQATVEVVEYLVWFWYHWPWVPVCRSGDARQVLRLTGKYRAGLAARRAVDTCLPVAGVLPQKRAALAEYKSQTTRLSADKPWPVLGDVGGGEFLQWFFQPKEFFKRSRFTAGVGAEGPAGRWESCGCRRPETADGPGDGTSRPTKAGAPPVAATH